MWRGVGWRGKGEGMREGGRIGWRRNRNLERGRLVRKGRIYEGGMQEWLEKGEESGEGWLARKGRIYEGGRQDWLEKGEEMWRGVGWPGKGEGMREGGRKGWRRLRKWGEA